MKKSLLTLAVFALPIFAGMSNVHAESRPIDKNARLKMGANASFNQYAYAQDNDVTFMPQAFYDNNRVYIEGAEAGMYGYKDAQNEWRLTLGYDSRQFNPEDATKAPLKGLDEREWSVMAGSSYMRITPYGGFKVQAETDALGRNKGTGVKLAHLSKFKLLDDKVTVYPELGLQWFDDKYNNYYFGVSQQESTKSGVAKYQADSSVSPYLNVSASYAITPKWSAFISQNVEWLSDEQKDSPLVEDNINSKTKIGFNYQF
ncbi:MULTISPECIES: MipA/OmpV family protein [unclassified Moraxella]|uniref:MipA/OmpV family protein n=1 Tax=unclassified Moraxella TaxID=2685852 RepID=UPI003AF8A042